MTRWRGALWRCGESLNLEVGVIEQLYEFTRDVNYGDNNSSTIAETPATKRKKMKNKSFIRLPPDANSLHQHCLRANYLPYIMRHPSLKHHPSPFGHGWELVGVRCRSVCLTRPALPTHLPAPRPVEESGEGDSEEEGGYDVQRRADPFESDDPESSEADCSDSD